MHICGFLLAITVSVYIVHFKYTLAQTNFAKQAAFNSNCEVSVIYFRRRDTRAHTTAITENCFKSTQFKYKVLLAQMCARVCARDTHTMDMLCTHVRMRMSKVLESIMLWNLMCVRACVNRT